MFTSKALEDLTVNRAKLAEVLGESLVTIDSHVRRGMPFIARGNKGREWQFNLKAAVQWRIDDLLFRRR